MADQLNHDQNANPSNGIEATDPGALERCTMPSPETQAEGGLLSDAAVVFGADSNRRTEAQQLDQIDKAEDDVEQLFEAKHRTAASPVHSWVWNKRGEHLSEVLDQPAPEPAVAAAMAECINFVRQEKEAGTIYDEKGKIAPHVEAGLAERGYYGALVSQEHGGWGASFSNFIQMLQQMATVDPTVAGQASIHGCIGAVDPVTHYGNTEQQAEHLPQLASGRRLSAFALTEPGAGSDLTNIQTEAVDCGDHFKITGEKLFISNVKPDGKVGLVAKLNGKTEVFVIDLPEREVQYKDGVYVAGDSVLTEKPQFAFRDYGLNALKHIYNRGLIFNEYEVPKSALLKGADGELKPGSGLTIAYHGLNKGRVALCANAAGTMTTMMADMLPWTQERKTYNYPIADRELVQNRIGRLATRIAGATALAEWSAALIDEGYRGELECIVAKNFGAFEMRQAAIEDAMVTHGGRFFLKKHPIGDNIHDILAPSIYEGEKEMLSMALFKSLVKDHAQTYLVPIQATAKKLLEEGTIEKFDPNKNPAQFWYIKSHLISYGLWMVQRNIETRLASGMKGPKDMPKALRQHFDRASQGLRMASLEISSMLIKYQNNLQHKQCLIQDLSDRSQKMVAQVVTALWGAQQKDPVDQLAAQMLCERIERELSGKRPDEQYFKQMAKLGKRILDGDYKRVEGINPAAVLMRYDEKNRVLNEDGTTSATSAPDGGFVH